MAIGDIYTDKQVDEEISKILPEVNRGKSIPIPRELLRSLLMAENMGETGAHTFANRRSHKAATGVAQVTDNTLKLLKDKKFLPADFNLDLSTASLRDQIYAGAATVRDFVDRYKTVDPKKIGALYNSGDPGAKKYLASGNPADLPKETQGYLTKIDKAYKVMDTPIPASPATVQPSPLFSATPMQTAISAYDSLYSPETTAGVMDALFSANKTINAAAGEQKVALQAGAKAAGQVATMQAEDAIAQQAVHREIMESLGMDATNPNSLLRRELQISADARKQREDTGKRISELQGKTLFSDPIGWIMAQPELAAMIPEYNRLVDIENSADNSIAKRQAVQAAAKNATPARSADLIRAGAQANAEQFLQQANAQAAQVTAQNAAGNARLVLDMFRMEEQRADNQFKVASYQDASEERKYRTDLIKEDKDKKAAAKLVESKMMLKFNSMRKLIAGDVPDMTWDEFKAMGGQAAKDWDAALTRGGFGNDYAESIPFIGKYGNVAAAGNSGNASMMRVVMQLKQEAEKTAPELQSKFNMANPLAKINDQQALDAAYRTLFNNHKAYANKMADKGSMGSEVPYAIDWEAAAASAAGKGVKGNIVSDVLLRLKEQSPYESLNPRMNPRKLIDNVEAEVVAGRVEPKLAAQQIAVFLKAATDMQYRQSGLQDIGLPPVTDYVVSPGGYGKAKIDFYNPTAAENYFTSKVLSRKRITEAAKAGVNFPFGVDPFGINK